MTSISTASRRRWRSPGFLLATPSIVWYTLFFVLPIAFIIYYSFGTKDNTLLLPVDVTKLTTANYSEVFDPTFFSTFKATLRIAVIATTLCVVIGLPVAYFAVYKVSSKWRVILLAAVVVPSFTSFLIRTVAWRIPLAPLGSLSQWFMDMGWVGPNGIQILETSTAVQIAIVYNYLGFMILPLYVALDRIDIRMREAGKDLGAGRIATFFSVTLPLAGPGVAAGVLLTFIPMCGDYVTARVLGGTKGNMIGAMIGEQFGMAQNWPLGSAMAVLMIVAVLLSLAVGAAIIWAVPRVGQMFSPAVASVRRWNARRIEASLTDYSPKWWSRLDVVKYGFAVWTSLVVLFLFIPIVLVIVHSFNSGQAFTIWTGHPTLKWWDELFAGEVVLPTLFNIVLLVLVAMACRWALAKYSNVSARALSWITPTAFILGIIYGFVTTEGYRNFFDYAGVGDSIRNSFTAALGATFIAVAIGGLAGVALARRPGWWTKAFMGVVFLILVTPEIMDAVALATWFPRIADVPLLGSIFRDGWGPFTGGMNKLWVGQSLYASAVVTLIVRARLAGLDESLEEAAADLGATPSRAFRQITLPLIAPALVAGGLLSFTLCLDNAVISTLVSEGGSTTFPVALLGATKSTIKPFWGVGAVILFATTMGALSFVAVVLKRSGSSSTDIAATLTGQ